MAESDSKMAASPLHREESPAEDHLHRSSNLPLAAHKGTCWKLTTAENLQKFQILQRPMTRTTFPPTFSELLLVAYASAVHKNAKQGSHAWKKNRRVNLMQEWASLHQHHQWCLNLAFLLILQLHHTSSPSPWYDQAMRSSAAFILPDRSKSGWMGPPSFSHDSLRSNQSGGILFDPALIWDAHSWSAIGTMMPFDGTGRWAKMPFLIVAARTSRFWFLNSSSAATTPLMIS